MSLIRRWHLVLLALIVVLLWMGRSHSPVPESSELPQVSLAPVSAEPLQQNLTPPAELEFGQYSLRLLAEFALEARVLARERYRMGREADLSPWDFALGWGRMAEPEIARQFTIRQSGRWYYWRTEQLPIPQREVEISSANMHLIPANDQVREALDRVNSGSTVSLRGFLVEARGEDGWRWRSSMSREDTGDGACELILVTDVL
ncbi:MAG: hypothetical protein AB7D26_10880 [Marinobacterium sp.]|jgi:hypothetical protein|uniref:Uncharacterized protein n=1 Tax=Marinobacterium iners DSM 11526 TaxID=1122198 RepID=A0A1H4AQX2_9GAMM|nr:hypothetical protein [Marinobacterium iners]SEA38305.1 hypothetical protein SAMN02745729_10332 [Marinobacterium iners DSM 11526]